MAKLDISPFYGRQTIGGNNVDYHKGYFLMMVNEKLYLFQILEGKRTPPYSMNIVRIYPLIIHVRKSTKQLNIYVLDVLEAHIIPM